ncbi:hypothetical protein ART_1258 [Arthrobacter sp. PAMC 25486]|nr:hypothetical protein ART_1258 [Arthrobacter sp. PAMC 25486]
MLIEYDLPNNRASCYPVDPFGGCKATAHKKRLAYDLSRH